MNELQLHDRWLRVPLGAGHADFHYKWLRHQCDLDRHPTTGERIVDPSEIPDDVRPSGARIERDVLVVEWSHDARVSRFQLAFLDEHAYARDRAHASPPPSDVASITLHRAGSIDDVVATALGRLDASGAVVVRRDRSIGLPPEDETESIVNAFAARGLRVIGTHFGRIEDLRTDNSTNNNTDQLGYTDAPVDLHTDQPFLEQPPRLQLLQSVRAAAAGGENYVVDALAAARYLESIDRRAFEVLSTVPVRFHRKQKAFESLVVAPILDVEGHFRIRYSYFTMAPFQRPFAEMEEWYRAYDRFAKLVRDPRHQYRFALAAGDFLLYDNHRMLHARTGFRGARWVRGIYFDR